jgi:glycosyltransferase involved in cell wall biosynthesis
LSNPVSLIATIKDEGDSIRPFLEGLLEQSRPPEEIVLADGGSSDSTVAEIERVRERSSVPIRLVEAPGTNISEGRNVAIGEASHDVIAVTDAGTRPNPDWLELLVAPLERDEAASVASGFFLPGGKGWRQRALAIAITPQREEIDAEEFLPSSRSIAFRRDWWQRVGGYPEWLLHCEDLVFDLDLRSAGASFVFVPDSVVVWDARPDLRSFGRQYFNYARGDGHANLWPKRHLLRYGAYTLGALLLARRRSPATLTMLALGWLGYQAKYFRRLLRIPASDQQAEQLKALAYVPVVVTVGDAAKLIGYALGSWERLSGTAPGGRRPD